MECNIKNLPWDFNFEDIDLLKQVNKTNIALWKLDWVSLKLPNSRVLIEFISIKEWVKSNAIENINTTVADAFASEVIWIELASFENKETLNYKEAIINGFANLRKKWWVWYNDILEINKIITGNTAWIFSSPDKHIKKWDKIIYTPPIWKDLIENLLKNYEKYFNDFNEETQIDPLMKLPLLHYQFEAIHPFWDGNWRTWRILIILYLVLHNKLSLPILFLSDFINSHKDEYYNYLNSLDSKHEEILKEFTLWLLKWIEEYSFETMEVVEKILDMQKNYKKVFKEDDELCKIYSKDIIDYLFIRPIYSIETLLKYLPQVKSRQTASKYLKLIKAKWLINDYSIWKYKFFYNEWFLNLLTQEENNVKKNAKN
jgi:Fic family protein